MSLFVVVLCWLVSVGVGRADERVNQPKPSGEHTAANPNAALSGLFGGSRRASLDPEIADLEALWQELSERPLAKTAGKPGLDRARAELTRLQTLIGRRAEASAIARRKQLVWAALSVSDRQMARAELAEALRTAMLRRERAEQQLKAAKLANESAATPAAPVERVEPPK
jgi:hypothetical protein